jgi:rhodanese-related sulfurtransferase
MIAPAAAAGNGSEPPRSVVNPAEHLAELWSRVAGNVLDLRPRPDFEAGHLAGAVHHPLSGPAEPSRLEEELPSIFLPPREEPLLVLAAREEEAFVAAAHLEARGRAPVAGAALDPAIWSGLPPSLRETGASRRHLWAAPPWLTSHADLLPPCAAGPVLDLACGSGRAAVWLAERGYRVTGLDWQPEALALGRRLAASRGSVCDFRTVDLRDPAAVPPGPWAVLLNFRFLDRRLLAVAPRLVMPGGVAMVRTFREAPGYAGHPRPRHRLRPWELTRLFPRGQWEILAHDQGFDPDGRPAAGVVARRKAVT